MIPKKELQMPDNLFIMPSRNYTAEECAEIVALAGFMTPMEVAAETGCHPSTVTRMVKRKAKTGSARSPPRPGRSSQFTLRDFARVRRIIKDNRFETAADIHRQLKDDFGYNFGISTFRRMLAHLSLNCRVARSSPLTDRKKRRSRLQYAKKHGRDSVSDWRRTIYVDEALARLGAGTRPLVWREKGEEWLPQCMVPKLQQGGKSFMMFAGIWHGGRTALHRFDCSQSKSKKKGVTAMIYRDQITKGVLKAGWQRVNNRWRAYGGARIVEDNARIHTSLLNRSAGKAQRFKYLDHPPSSPDLNPIEHCWAYIKRKYAKLPRRPTTLDGLFEVMSCLWDEMPQGYVDACIDSMPRRLKEVKKRRGYPTRY